METSVEKMTVFHRKQNAHMPTYAIFFCGQKPKNSEIFPFVNMFQTVS